LSYEPKEPYEFKSGRREGKVLELMMFKNYGFLNWYFNKKLGGRGVPENKKNELHRHLEWLLDKGENRRTELLCPYCGKRKVKLFSLLDSKYGFSIGPHYTCCNNMKCKGKVQSLPLGKIPMLLPFKFSQIKKFRAKSDQKRVGDLFRKVFGLPTRPDPLTRETAFQFFKEPP